MITLVSSYEYLEAANVLFYSISKHISIENRKSTSFYALIIDDHGVEANYALYRGLKGWKPCIVPLVPARDPERVYTRFREQFTKLLLWNMTQFERIVYLDSDTLVIGDFFKPLLLEPKKEFAAVRDWENGAIRNHFNMGVFSVRPNRTEFLRLDEFRRTKTDYRVDTAEQGMLNSVYGYLLQIVTDTLCSNSN